MASPVSIGDALLLGKIAFKLGRAFTSGRKSAPAEFREVENQLFALSTALSALHCSRIAEQWGATASSSDTPMASELEEGQDGVAMLNAMLDNCRATLSHLEGIVEKYATLKEKSSAETPIFKRWSKRLVQDIRKIEWTTEGGDLATLRSQLMVHINSINVVLGVVNNAQIGQLGNTLNTAVDLLKEIQDYVSNSLREIPMDSNQELTTKGPPLTQAFFRLYLATARGEELVCDHCLISSDWDKKHRTSEQGDVPRKPHLFICACPSSAQSGLTPHSLRLESFSLTPLSFAIRLIDVELMWMVYKVADRDNGNQVSVTIKGLSPTYMLDFDELFIQKLSVGQSRRWLHQGLGTTLAFAAPNASGQQEARVMNLLGDVSSSRPFVEKVTFSFNGRKYSRSDIDDLQLTQYFACSLTAYLDENAGKSLSYKPQEFAEITLFYEGGTAESEDDVVKTTLRLKFDSKVEYDADRASVSFPDIHCISTGARGESSDLPSGRVTITFSVRTAAQSFWKKVRQMCAELSIILLRLPRSNEVVVMSLQVGGVHTEEIAMSEADISIVQNTNSKAFRLMITSHDGRTVLSQKLAPDFMGIESSGTNFRSLTWAVHVQENGRTRITKHPSGFNHLVLSDVRTNKLFEHWIRSQLWQASLPTRTVPLIVGSGNS